MNVQQISFRKGEPQLFIATKPFSLGSTGVTIRVGDQVSFDGQTAEIDGQEFQVAMLKGAIKAGWLVPADEYEEGNPEYLKRVRADIKVRPTNGGNPLQPKASSSLITTESDEREVGSVSAHASKTASANKNYVRGKTAVNSVVAGTKVKSQHGMMVVEEQDGVILDRKLNTAAGERSKERINLDSDRASQAMHLAKNVQITAGEGISQDDMLDRMDPDDREEYLAKKEALRAQYVNDTPKTKALPRPNGDRVVGRVQSKAAGHHEGMKFTNSIGKGGSGAIGQEHDGVVVATMGKDEVETFESEGMKFTTTNGPKNGRKAVVVPVVQKEGTKPSADAPKPVPANLDTRRKIAKMVCPDFPETYDFNLSPKKKIARLTADFEDRHDVLQAVYAAESDDMKELLLQEFPAAFTQ